MGVFSRLGDIVNSNINAMLDRAEDPEKMIRLMIQEMEDTLVDLKSSCASRMATRAEMLRDRDSLSSKVARWNERAALAVERSRDDLAKEALLEKKQCEKQLDFTEKDLEQYEQLISECKNNIAQLEKKLEEVSLKYKMLAQRSVHAYEKKRARTMMSSAGGAQAMMRFEEVENRIERMEAEADLAGRVTENDLDREFSKLESDNAVNDELEELKKRMNKTASRGAAGKKTAEKADD